MTISYTIWDYPLAEIRWRPVAIRASRGNLTFGYLWGRLSIDPVQVRTAYGPEGDGTTIAASKNLHQFSLATDLGTSLAWKLTESEVGDVRLHGTAMVRNVFRGARHRGPAHGSSHPQWLRVR